jgi:hypothetical protein
MIKQMQVILIVNVMLLIGSCLYVPTHEHGDSMIPDEAMNFLVPGKTTRADVLLRFGDPIQRLEEDRYFIYHWETVIGYMIYGGGYHGDVTADENLHYLCLEFSPDGLLYRWKHFEEGYLQIHPEKKILKWMKENPQQQ